MKLVVLGSGAVGKSALTIQFVSRRFVSLYDPTIEDRYQMQVEVDTVPTVLDILDTAGQDEFSAMRDNYMREGDGFLVVYSVASRQSFADLASVRQRLCKVKDVDAATRLPLVMCGNKCDLPDVERHVARAEGVALANQWHCAFLETSAKEQFNVDAAFHEAVRLVRQLATPKRQVPERRRAGCCLL
eukprot:TRINITY_DN1886_c0_g4_i1.p1 TRINITY_DN1886_c0_g4~~TRINITY_DN1886_c0_g4_i1.p1  ORF type:complete len:187 (-),score=50.48 TRINITY_DN1886_c0_g4_i1:663-1223(-)